MATFGAADFTGITTAISGGCTDIAGVIPALATAAIGVGVLIFGVKLGWRLVRSLARG